MMVNINVARVIFHDLRFLSKYKRVQATINMRPCSVHLMMNLWYRLLLKCFDVKEKKAWNRKNLEEKLLQTL